MSAATLATARKLITDARATPLPNRGGKLDIDGGSRGEFVRVAVQVGLEGDAVFRDLAEVGEAEDLKTAGIGEEGAGPGHEAVQSAELADQVGAGAEEKVVGVAEDDL